MNLSHLPWRAKFLSAVLLNFAALVLHAAAQSSNSTSVYFTPIYGPIEVQYEWPGDVAADSRGNAYVVYSGGSYGIQKIAPSGDATGFAGAMFGFSCLTVDASDNLYAVDAVIIRRFAPDGAAMRLTASGFVSDNDRTTPAVVIPRVHAMAVDARGIIYLASNQHTILKVTTDGAVSTFAGATDEPGSADGTTSARFRYPMAIAVDRNGNVFVADSGNHAVRKITPDGVVSTFAGITGTYGIEDGTGHAARFRAPHGIGIDRFGTLYVLEDDDSSVVSNGIAPSFGERIRRITPSGAVTTLTPSGEFAGGGGFAVNANGTFYVTDDFLAAVYMGVPAPTFVIQPAAQSVAPGARVTFSATATSAIPVTYQWQKDGVEISGATDSTLAIDNAQTADLGTYTLVATNKAGSTTSYPAALSFAASSANALINLSVRSNVGTGAQALIVGFAIGGTGTTGTKPLLVRGIGPSLDAFGVTDSLADPMLTVFSGNTVIAANDNWNGDAQSAAIATRVGAFALTPAASRDAALYVPGLATGVYTMQISGVGGTSGVALAEIYDATTASDFNVSAPRLINLSARAQVGTDPLIAGFTIGGTTAKTLLLRAIGPTLGTFGVTNALSDPKLELFQGTSLFNSNDNWGGDAAVALATAKAGAFPLSANSRDAAMLVTLPPGSYSVRVSDVTNIGGVALVEIYEVP